MAEHSADYKRVAKNTAFLYLRQLIVVLVGLYTSRVVLRVLGETDFGIYNIVGAVVIFLSFLKQALTNATSRFFTYDLGRGEEASLGKTFSMSMNVHMILAAIVFVILEIAGPIAVSRLNIPAERMGVAQVVFQFSLLNFVLEIIRTDQADDIVVIALIRSLEMLHVRSVFLPDRTVHISDRPVGTLVQDQFILRVFTVMPAVVGTRIGMMAIRFVLDAPRKRQGGYRRQGDGSEHSFHGYLVFYAKIYKKPAILKWPV